MGLTRLCLCGRAANTPINLTTSSVSKLSGASSNDTYILGANGVLI